MYYLLLITQVADDDGSGSHDICRPTVIHKLGLIHKDHSSANKSITNSCNNRNIVYQPKFSSLNSKPLGVQSHNLLWTDDLFVLANEIEHNGMEVSRYGIEFRIANLDQEEPIGIYVDTP